MWCELVCSRQGNHPCLRDQIPWSSGPNRRTLQRHHPQWNCAKAPCRFREKLNSRDRKLLNEARRSGHTHIRTTQPAVRAKLGRDGISHCAMKRGRGGEEPPDSPRPCNKRLCSETNNIRGVSERVCVKPSALEQERPCFPLLPPGKRLRTKSSLLLAIPHKRLKVKTTLPHKYAQNTYFTNCIVKKRMFCTHITAPTRPAKRLTVKTTWPCFTAPCVSSPNAAPEGIVQRHEVCC